MNKFKQYFKDILSIIVTFLSACVIIYVFKYKPFLLILYGKILLGIVIVTMILLIISILIMIILIIKEKGKK